jgi:hypothetical protein
MPRSSPAFEVAVRNQLGLQGLIAALVSCAATCALLAVMAHRPGFWPSLALVPLCGLLAWRLARVAPRQLQWDGQVWRLAPAELNEPGPATSIEVVIDFGSWVLLRARATQGFSFKRVYLPMSQAVNPGSWGLFRATLFSAKTDQ